MSIQFRKLRLKNWLVYGGKETVIQFSEFNKGNNLVIFHGKNGFGKTSLLRALEFLFTDDYRTDDYIEVWNEKEKISGYGELHVTLEFLYHDELWVLSKGASFEPRGRRIIPSPFVKLWIDGEDQQDQIDDYIRSVIPKECLQFVFFDGAEITRYAQAQQEGVKEAIELMLGIPAVRNLRHDLERVLNELQSEQEVILREEQKNSQLLSEIHTLDDQAVSFTDRIKDSTQKLKSIELAQQQLDQETIELEIIQKEQEAIQERRKRREDILERTKEIDAELDSLIQFAPIKMLLGPLEQIASEWHDQRNTVTQLDKYKLRKKLLKDLLKEDTCICDRPIDEVINSRFERLIDQFDEYISEYDHITKIRSQDLFSIQGTITHIKEKSDRGTTLYKKLAGLNQQIEEIDTDIERQEAHLGNNASIQVKELIERQRVTQREYGEVEGQLRNAQAKLEEIRKLRAEKQREVNQVTSTTDRGIGIAQTLETTRNLLVATEQFVLRLVERKRLVLEAITSDIFKQITNKPDEYDGVRVSDDYTLEVYRYDGTTIDNTQLSAGEREVLAYSFITALNLSSPTPVPFVMDTPFGHLDSIHRDRLLKSLPMLPVQVFLLATDRDLPPTERGTITAYITDEFEIIRDQSNNISYIEEAE